MVFLRYQDRYLSREGKFVEEKQFFFTTPTPDGAGVHIHTLGPGPRVYLGYQFMTEDPFAAAAMRVIPNDTGFMIQYASTQEYWKVGCDYKVTITSNAHEATRIHAESWVEQGVDMDVCLQEIQSKGYTILRNIIPVDVVDQLKLKLSLPEKLTEGEIQKRHGDLLEKDEIFCAAVSHPMLMTIIRMYLHPKAKCATWSSNTLYPREGPVEEKYDWHVDYPYHEMQSPWQVEPLSAQVLWCLDDFRHDNGGTFIIPFSHRARTFPTDKSVSGKQVDVLAAPKGSVVISHGGWWHSQGINRSKECRSCLLGTFVQPWIQPKDDMARQYHALSANHPYKTAVRDVLGLY